MFPTGVIFFVIGFVIFLEAIKAQGFEAPQPTFWSNVAGFGGLLLAAIGAVMVIVGAYRFIAGWF